jgi:tetratricopeptide (TPR) repeat protein
MNSNIVNKLLCLALLMGSVSLGFAQKGKKTDAAGPTPSNESGKPQGNTLDKSYKSMYSEAIKYGDFAVATQAVYGLMSLHPDSTALLDTLAALYFQRGAWPQVILVTTNMLEINSSNIAALELRAVANQSIGRAKESLADYEALFAKNSNPYHLYEIAALQFAMKRFGECEGSVQRLLGDKSIEEKTIVITLQDGRSQDVPLAAAAMNLHGVMNMEQGKKDVAKNSFEMALKVYPEFLLAKNNLDALGKEN